MPRRRSVLAEEAHDIYLKYHRHHEGEDLVFGVDDDDAGVFNDDLGGHDKPAGPNFKMFHRVMKTGVIYATSRARSKGFCTESVNEWAK